MYIIIQYRNDTLVVCKSIRMYIYTANFEQININNKPLPKLLLWLRRFLPMFAEYIQFIILPINLHMKNTCILPQM